MSTGQQMRSLFDVFMGMLIKTSLSEDNWQHKNRLLIVLWYPTVEGSYRLLLLIYEPHVTQAIRPLSKCWLNHFVHQNTVSVIENGRFSSQSAQSACSLKRNAQPDGVRDEWRRVSKAELWPTIKQSKSHLRWPTAAARAGVIHRSSAITALLNITKAPQLNVLLKSLSAAMWLVCMVCES